MKQVLIADDRLRKLHNVSDIMKGMYPDAEVLTFECGSDLIRHIKRKHKEIQDDPWQYLVITDMQMPDRMGETINSQCGYVILHNMQDMELQVPAIVVSSESIIDEKARDSYNDFAGSIFWTDSYDQTEDYRMLLNKYYEEKRAIQD